MSLINQIPSNSAWTICSKHSQINDLVGNLQSEMEKFLGGDLLQEIQHELDKIENLCNQAKEDGQKMERGLTNKNQIIADLEAQLKEAENTISNLENS